MNKHLIVIAVGTLCLSAQVGWSQDKPAEKPATPAKPADAKPAAAKSDMTEGQQIGYAIGQDIANNLKQQFEGMDVDLPSVAKGLDDGLKGTKKMTDEQMKAVTDTFRRKMMEKMMEEQTKQQAQRDKEAPKNLEEGKKFLAENAKKADVKTTPSGLQYSVIKEGTGEKPKATDTVSVHYKGTLINGKEFDSSIARGEPATFPLNGVIKGWTEGLQLMKVGSKYKFFIPSELGYGEKGAGADIPGNSVLVFEVELLKIEK